MSDHCPIRAVLKVKISLQSSTIKDNSFVDNPSILSWNKDISYRFENVLQSEEILKHFNKFLCKDIGNSQDEIDKSTKELTNILIAGAIQADQAPKFNRKVDKKAGSRRKSEKRGAHPKWHDISCAEAHSKVIATARLLKGSPKNSILISKLKTETKQYNKLVKSKHKQFIDNMFDDLDTMQHNNPRGYMQLIRSMREGNVDKKTPDDTSGVSPADWYSHFRELLAQNIETTRKKELNDILHLNVDIFKSKLDEPFY